MIYKLEVDKEQLELISQALGAMPYGRVVQLIMELQKQVTLQEQEIAVKGNGDFARVTQP